ncbi:MAG: sigma-70 family RNA polymerase sigma factor [Ilumatobacteraceae bacterium]|nr:sigma-70 family RNA polymerase sigma factor [Ilumatobacteraceae bacterium]
MATADTTRSFEQLYADELPRLVPTLHALTGDRASAEDLAQDALRRAHEHWAEISSYDRPGAWVRRVALNLAANAARGRGREARALQLVRPAAPVELPATDEALWALVRELPEQQRHAVVLHYVEDQTVADVAAVLEVSEGTVKTHLSRARATLAARLAETSGADHA